MKLYERTEKTAGCVDSKENNEWVLNKAGVKRELLDVRHRRSKEAGILWSHHEETRELPGERDNARNNARSTQARKAARTAWVDYINTWTGLPVEESMKMTQDRDK